MSKSKGSRLVYACQTCGFQSPKWLGKCPDCGEWNGFIEERAAPSSTSDPAKVGMFGLSATRPLRYADIESQDDSRRDSGIAEFDRVLGGGIVPGSLVLIGGEPGVGKSTLMAQVAGALSDSHGTVLYVSGEESERQIKLRGERLGLKADGLFLLPETCLERVLEQVDALGPAAIIVDSVQTVFSMKLESAPGSVSQVREVAGQFLILAKNRSLPVFLIGHVTKDGQLAGPKALEHIVDTVLYFEGERHHNHRIIRAVKNRFGAANEIGIFEMTERGLVPVANPSAMFLSERPVGAAGSVVVAALEGSRPILVELQALVSSSQYGTGKRMTVGVDANRVSLLMAMLEKRLGMHLIGDDVYLNVAGGIELDEPAVDLGLVAAIVSSYRNRAIDERTVVFGEVGLAGEVRAISQASSRLREAVAMGFRRAVLPQTNIAGLPALDDGLELVGVRSVAEAIDALF
ncbi:MAG: DNA repair protein RadA [Blastocatellia bacterium]|jgi:DNA repair protein RadA/Sms|nr:DNA repair protein RadA [Blastocatellia bacterium]